MLHLQSCKGNNYLLTNINVVYLISSTQSC